jgi:hypothetical protein
VRADAIAGLYNVRLDPKPAPTSSAVAPIGSGYVSFTVGATTGRLTAKGRLSDGTAVTMASFAGPSGQILMYRPLYATAVRGSILGQLGIEAQAVNAQNTVEGTLTWSRPANAAASNRLYRAGFPGVQTVEALGARYVAPTRPTAANPGANPRVLGLTDAANEVEVLLTGAGVEAALPTQTNVRGAVSTTNRVTFSADPLVNPRKMTLSFNAATGSFTGRVTLVQDNPQLPPPAPVVRSATFQGLLVGNKGAGYFLLNQLPGVGQTPSNSPQEAGLVEVVPVPPPAP